MCLLGISIIMRGSCAITTSRGVARHGKLPPRRHEELPPPWIAEERVNERGTNRGKLVVD
ncbi:hypothetical protein EAS54_26285 [Bradyrhizobium guangzhouense]|nr:hypothetical protein EAS54_26285 [Bradyrhizobium guangzhouense]